MLFGALLAAGGTYFYKNYTISQLENEAILLDGAVNTFSIQDFKQVQEFNESLEKAKDRVDNTVSIVAVLDEMDRITAQPIQINDLALEREGDQRLILTINFSTETLDAALFQRKVLTANSALFSDVTISEVDIQSGAEAVLAEGVATPPAVTFIADFSIPLSAALYDPLEARRTDIGVYQSSDAADILNIPEVDTTENTEPDFEDTSSLSDEIIPLDEDRLEDNETTI